MLKKKQTFIIFAIVVSLIAISIFVFITREKQVEQNNFENIFLRTTGIDRLPSSFKILFYDKSRAEIQLKNDDYMKLFNYLKKTPKWSFNGVDSFEYVDSSYNRHSLIFCPSASVVSYRYQDITSSSHPHIKD